MLNKDCVRRLTCLQTIDTANVGNKCFIARMRHAQTIYRKPETILKNGSPITSNAYGILLQCSIYSILQPEHIVRLEKVSIYIATLLEYISQKVCGAYIIAVARLDMTSSFAQPSQVTNPELCTTKALDDSILILKEHINYNLKLVSVDMSLVQLAVFSDASLASNAILISQSGYAVKLADASGKTITLHYSPVKSGKVKRSVFAAKLMTAVHVFGYTSTLKATFNKTFGYPVPLF